MQNKSSLLALSAILLFSLIIRLPLISSGIPYFYDQDEAHHFNRQVEMLKSGDLNPKYFLKPSLNFYVRLPVLAAGFLWTVKSGNIKEVQDIQTRDKFGLAGYSFTTSHPTLLKFDRAFSIFLALLCIFFTYLIALELTNKVSAGIFAALALSVSPLLYEHSISVGVNVLAATFIAAALWLSVRNYNNFKWKYFIWLCLTSGLAVSSKYNALPVLILPVLAVLNKGNFTAAKVFTALLLPWAAFLAASPFIIAEIPLFLNNLAYEVWHYGVEGHEGHSAEPGIAQLLFFINNLCSYTLGLITTLLTATGIILAAYYYRQKSIALGVFALLFFALLISQKANFDRNLLLVLPVLAVFAGVCFQKLQEYTQSTQLVLPLVAVFLLQPSYLSVEIFKNSFSVDSRQEVYEYVRNLKPEKDLALHGDLQLPLFVHYERGQKKISRRGIERVNFEEGDALKYYLQGFDQFVIGPNNNLNPAELFIFSNPEFIAGDPTRGLRVLVNPMVAIFTANIDDIIKNAALPVVLNYSTDNVKGLKAEMRDQRCQITVPSVNEDYFWINSRLTPLDLSACQDTADKLHLEVMSPWAGQKFGLINLKTEKEFTTTTKVGEFQEYIFDLKEISKAPTYLYIDQIHSPQSYGFSADSRRLGLAFIPG